MKRLFLDDNPKRAEKFLNEYPGAKWVETAADCIKALNEYWDEIHLDHDLGGKVYVDSSRPDTGMEVVRHIIWKTGDRFKNTIFTVHSWNHKGAEHMITSLSSYGYIVNYKPFGRPHDKDRDNYVEALKHPEEFFIEGAIILNVDMEDNDGD